MVKIRLHSPGNLSDKEIPIPDIEFPVVWPREAPFDPDMALPREDERSEEAERAEKTGASE